MEYDERESEFDIEDEDKDPEPQKSKSPRDARCSQKSFDSVSIEKILKFLWFTVDRKGSVDSGNGTILPEENPFYRPRT